MISKHNIRTPPNDTVFLPAPQTGVTPIVAPQYILPTLQMLRQWQYLPFINPRGITKYIPQHRPGVTKMGSVRHRSFFVSIVKALIFFWGGGFTKNHVLVMGAVTGRELVTGGGGGWLPLYTLWPQIPRRSTRSSSPCSAAWSSWRTPLWTWSGSWTECWGSPSRPRPLPPYRGASGRV